MPGRCVAAGCSVVGGQGHSLHTFPADEAVRRRWVSAVKRQRRDWNGPSSHSRLCSKHFAEDSFATEGVRFRDQMGIPFLKRLKSGAVPTIFTRSWDLLEGSSSAPTSRPLSKRREQRSREKSVGKGTYH